MFAAVVLDEIESISVRVTRITPWKVYDVCKDISSVWTLIIKWAMCASISVSVIASVEDVSMLSNHLTVITY